MLPQPRVRTVSSRVEAQSSLVELYAAGVRSTAAAGRVGPVQVEVVGLAERLDAERASDGGADVVLGVEVLASEVADGLGFQRVLFRLTPTVDGRGGSGAAARSLVGGSSGVVRVWVDYGGFVDEFGADWAGRLQLVAVDDCVVARRDRCAAPVVVPSGRDVEAGLLYAEVPLSQLAGGGGVVYGLMAGGSSSTGDYSMTSLNPSGLWAVGEQSGEFTWSYPVQMPASAAGPLPDVSVTYRSGLLDGLTADQNTQGGVLGPGWVLSEGFVERQFKPCGLDGSGTNDLCWSSSPDSLDALVVSFGAVSGKLIRMGTVSAPAGWSGVEYRLEAHDGWQFVRWGRTSSARGSLGVDDNGEYLVATDPAGSRYYFGYGERSGDFWPGTSLKSAQTVPVRGNHSGEPCYGLSSKWCHQTYRWSLDRVEDANGRVMVVRYAQTVNNYGVTGSPSNTQSYVAGSFPDVFEYGRLAAHNGAADWFSHRVRIDSQYRCNNPVNGLCLVPPTPSTGAHFPDIPVDRICTSSYCVKNSPTFFQTNMVYSIMVEVRDPAGNLTTVSGDLFSFDWADADGAGSDPARLWLRFIQHVGFQAGGTIWMPPIRFDSNAALPNRVDFNLSAGVSEMKYFRVTHISDEYGSELVVTYTQPKVCPHNVGSSSPPPGWNLWRNNTWSCFARWYSPASGPAGFGAWHKYVVDAVQQIDQSWVAGQRSPWRWWDYQYPEAVGNDGGMAWHSDSDKMVPVAQRSWGEYRGFQHVRVIEGNPAEPNRLRTDMFFHRGMHGDINTHSGSSPAPDVAYTPSTLGAVLDEPQLFGRPRESITGNVAGGQVYSGVVTDYTSWATTGSNGTSFQVAAHLTRSREVYAYGAVYGRVDVTFDGHAWLRRPVQIIDWGMVDAGYGNITELNGWTDDLCVQYSYTPVSDRFKVGLMHREQRFDNAACTAVLTDTRTYYDDQPSVNEWSTPAPAVPVAGNPTAVWRATGGNVSSAATGDGMAAWLPAIVERVAYGNNGYHSSPGFGRPVSLTDARGYQTTIGYATWGGTTRFPLRTVTTLNALAHMSVAEFDVYGNQIRATSPNQHSYTCFDALGRPAKVYEPGIPGGSTCTGDPSATYSYTFTWHAKNDPTVGSVTHPRWAVQTRTLFSLATDSWKPNSTSAAHYLEAWSLFDGYGRLAQTNQPSPVAAGSGFDRVVTRTLYDSRDNPVRRSQPIHQPGMPTGATYWDAPNWAVERDVSTTFDLLGRPLDVCDRDNDTVIRCAYTQYLSPRRVDSYPPVAPGAPVIGGTIRWTNTDGNVWMVAEADNTGGYSFTHYVYNRAGWLNYIVDPDGNHTIFSYNQLGWRTNLIDPNAGSFGTVYWPTGQVRHSRDANTQIIFNTIDPLGRTTHTADNYTSPTAGAGVLAEYWWDGPHTTGTLTAAYGMLTRVESRNGATVLARTELIGLDDMGRPATTRITVPAADNPSISGDEALAAPYQITISYTRNGVPRQTVYPGVTGSNLPSAETVTTLFNLHGLPVQTAGSQVYTEQINYDPYGRVIETWMGPSGSTAGLHTQYGFHDADGRLGRIYVRTRAGTLVTDATYSYDAVGNPTRIHHDSGANSETECFVYDARQRLTAAFTQNGAATCPGSVPGSGSGPAPYRLLYSFDALHRATSFEGRTMTYGAPSPGGCRGGTPATKPHALISTTTSSAGEPAQTLAYNCNGAITSQTITGVGTTTYTWDQQQRLATITTPAGTTTNFYDHTNNRVLRVDPTGTKTVFVGSTEIRYTPGVGIRVARDYGNARRDFSGDVTYYATNHQGTPTALTNTTSGPRILRTHPYGTPRTLPGSVPNLDDRNYLNQPDDPNTPTLYLKNRHYLPQLGIFLSADPLLNRHVPATLNPYLYTAGANPLAAHDNDGLCAKSTHSKAVCSANNKTVNTVVSVASKAVQSLKQGCWIFRSVCDFGGGIYDAADGAIHLVGGLAADGINCVNGCGNYEPNTFRSLRHAVTNPVWFLEQAVYGCIANPYHCAGESVFGGALGKVLKTVVRAAPTHVGRAATRTADEFFEVTATGANRAGTFIPESFNLTVADHTFFVNANATKHMAEYATSTGASSIPTSSLAGSVETAVQRGLLPGRNFIQVGPWELGIDMNDHVIYHAVYRPEVS